MIRTAKLLQRCASNKDLVGRWAGDQFIFLLPRTGKKETSEICRHIMGKTQAVEFNNIPLSLSMILTKASTLTDKEWDIIKEHTEKGHSIAISMEEFAPIAESILSHHERWDGNGYPRGLKGKDIPLLARIITIVDAYDVMTNGRPYKEAMTKKEAAAELKRCAGKQFDPELMEKFLLCI